MYIEREIINKFNKIKKIYSIIALVGARQSGKTTFLKEQIKDMKSTYLLFDDPDIRNLFEKDIKKFEIQYLKGKKISVLDEVHYSKEAGRNLKYLADNKNDIWITSSSEIILSKEVLSYLVGRVSIIKLYPFSLTEFLKAKKQKVITHEILQRIIWEHLTYGGYPKVITTNDVELKKIILKDLYDTMVLKDVANTFSINNISSLQIFTKYLAINTGKIISYQNLSNKINLSFQTILKYLNAMEKSHLITIISPFFSNKLKEITKSPKIYFIDMGLRNSIIDNFKLEFSGEAFENYVLSELIKLRYKPKYWRTKSKSEVDFIIEKNSDTVPIEVKSRSPKKITQSLKSFIRTYNPKKAIIVYYRGEKKKLKYKKTDIIFCNVHEMKNYLN